LNPRTFISIISVEVTGFSTPTGNSKLKESGLVPAQSDGSWRIAEVDQGDKPSSEVVVYE